MFKGLKTTLVIVAVLTVMVSCNETCEKEVVATDSTCVSVTEAVTVSDVSVTADSAQ